MEIREIVVKKYDIQPEDALRINETIDREFYGLVEKDGFQETEEWKQWCVKNEQLKKYVEEILKEFNF